MNKLFNIKQKITDGSFANSVTILMSGSAFSQIAVVLMTPFLTRLYGPEAFGLFSVYLSILYTLGLLHSLQYEVAIPLPEKDEDAINLLALSLIMLAVCTSIIAMMTGYFSHAITAFIGTPELGDYLWYLPLSLFGLGIFQIFQLWSLREETYAIIARGKVQMNLATIGSQSGLGLWSATSSSLIFGEAVGRIAGGFGLAALSWRHIKRNLSSLSLTKIKRMAIRYRRFPLITSWSTLLGGLSHHLPPLYIAGTLGVKEAGWYLVAHRILSFPDALLGYSVEQVYLAKSAKVIHTSFHSFVHLFWETVKKLSLISFIIFSLAAVIAPFAFAVIFGSSWEQAGVFVQCMSILPFIQLIVGPVSTNFDLLELQHIQMYCELLRFILLALGMVIVHVWVAEAWLVILCLSIAHALGFLVIGICSWYTLGLYQKQKRNVYKS
ncbi:lipopolysaccharide biosynthesis protein [Lentibacillus salinarum]|uniref:Lipopolysaccharide biosynthesis protein n=1 Tax=Lentibacillus salinarum TaxID=446820 RepID=A0ABW3ZQR5_9BACI